jgi:hypothetical protein
MVIGANSMGTNLNRMLDSLGYPDMVGDLRGAQVDMMTGNLAGALRNMRDAFSGLPTQGFEAMLGQMPEPFSMQSPRRGLGRSRLLHSNTYSNGMGSSRTEVRDLAMGRSRGAARSLESAIMRNPAFRNRMEGLIGGRILLDGRADGKITVVKQQRGMVPPNVGFGMTAGMAAMNPLAGTLFGSLARMDQELGQMIQGVGKKIGDTLMGQQGTGQRDIGELVGPNASIEDRLAAFLFTQMKEADKDLEGLMSKYKALGDKKKKKSGGLFGGIKNMFKGIGSKLFQVGGGILGGMVGGPLGAKLGQGIGGAVGSSVMGGGKKAEGGGDKEHSKSVLNFKIQQAMNKRKEMHDLISNILKTMHDMSMTSIRNIR